MTNKLFITPNKEFPIDALGKAIDSIIDSQNGSTIKNIVLFVHGRGGGKIKHPEKALTQQLPFIESEYDTKAILFNWEGSGKGGGTGFPAKEARNASSDFHSILSQLEKYKDDNFEKLSGVKFSLLTHSMGSIVVEETIIKKSQDIKPNLLDVLLLSSSASKSKKHSKWLNKASFAKHILVSINSGDGTLGLAGFLRGQRLGKGLKGKETSKRVNYVDLSNTGVKHRYFVARTKKGTNNGQKGNPCIKAIYLAALNGDPVDLKTFPGTQIVKNNRVFVIKSMKGNVCK